MSNLDSINQQLQQHAVGGYMWFNLYTTSIKFISENFVETFIQTTVNLLDSNYLVRYV